MPDPTAGDQLPRRLRIATAAIASAVLLVLDGPSVVAALPGFRLPAVELAAYGFVGFVLSGEWLLIRAGRSWGASAWWVSGALVLAHVAAIAGLAPDQVLEQADWSTGVVGWATLCVLFGRPFPQVIAVLVAEVALSAGGLAAADSGRPERLLGGAVALTAILAFQVCAAGAATALVRLAGAADAANRAREDAALGRRVAAELHAARGARYAELADRVAPLLEGLLSGALDPAAADVRGRCRVEAARMRRLFAEVDDVESPLLHELRAGADVAERRGVEVHLEVSGAMPELPRRVRHLLTEAPLAVVATADAAVRVVVVATPVSVSVSAVGVCESAPSVPQGDVDVVVTHIHDHGVDWVRAEHLLLRASPRS